METLYQLRIQIEELGDDGDYRYLGTSPDLPNLIVVGDSVEEVLAHAPGVARALLETMHEHGLPTPSLAEAPQPESRGAHPLSSNKGYRPQAAGAYSP